MRIKTLFLSVFFIFILCFTMVISIAGYEYVHKGLQSVPSTVYLSTTLSSNAQARCQAAMNTWNDTCFSYDCLMYGGTNNVSYMANEDNTNTITYLPVVDTYLGYTHYTQIKYTLLWLDWYLVEFDININANKQWYVYQSEHGITISSCSGDYDMESTVLHELGHALGLDHNTQQYYNGVAVVMYPALFPQTTVRDLSEDDRLGVVNLY